LPLRTIARRPDTSTTEGGGAFLPDLTAGILRETMKAKLEIYCIGCNRYIERLWIDTADMPKDLQAKVKKAIEAHREKCKFYGKHKTP
jgi:hypothetical protein